MLIAGGNYWTHIVDTTAIYSSPDAGISWSLSSLVIESPMCVASSADGSRSFVVGLDDWIYSSMDAGTNWVATGAPVLGWVALACSADGAHLVAASNASASDPRGLIYESTDGGITWADTGAPDLTWVSVVCTADGHRGVAAVKGGGIYISQTTPQPILNIASLGQNLLLSWLVPSMKFALQENVDFDSANWTDVTTTPALNYTNLHYQVTVPAPPGNRFYRLVSR
jgi:hypothetical protein